MNPPVPLSLSSSSEDFRASDDFTCSLQQEQTLSQDELMDGIKKGILKGFLELDEKLRRIPEVASGEDKSGTTAVCALITQKYLIIANCGDSRGVCCTDGKPVLATQVYRNTIFGSQQIREKCFLRENARDLEVNANEIKF